jgi:hypothetical protein
VDEWQSADERNNREKVDRARKAAEDLFKPAQSTVPSEVARPVPNDTTPKDQQSRRQPRIFTVPARLPLSPNADHPVDPQPIRRRAIVKRSGNAVPPSQIGRVRTLATYGMTPQQVAELYGVTVDEINRILKAPAYSGKSR